MLRRHCRQKIVKIIPDRQINFFPVIKSRSFYFAAFKRKAQRPDEMQKGVRGQAGPTDISSIPVDFRRNQDDMAFKLVASVIKAAFVQLWMPSLKFLTAVRTIEKSFVDRIAAESAQQPGLFLIGGLVPYELIFCSVTTLAYGERLAFFDSHYRNEKYA